ncbi:hypothetical protein [Sphingobacterium sp.]|uniref:hypothetical protein n=1 Tax=Sphingobacterium sp. TaxID=341027 RepID=UPI0028A5EA49|nr:hypothetical protein [Sphingobacterium sp.]
MSAFNKFKERVLASYWEKHKNNELHDRLANPTSANLRDYALFLLNEGMNPDDRKTLRDFFILKDELGDLEKSIAGIDIDKLKPVRYFIDGKTSNPDETIVKLLAVLIDFQPRPFRIDDWIVDIKPKLKEASILPLNQPAEKEHPKFPDSSRQSSVVGSSSRESGTNTSKFNKKAIMWVGSAGLIAASLGYITLKDKKECMVWFKDRYIVVDCLDNNMWNQKVIALDEERLKNFRKITRYDTLGLKDVNRIWYSKVNNEIEFFTTAGLHPEHSERGLKLASEYIIRKYAMGEEPDTSKNEE